MKLLKIKNNDFSFSEIPYEYFTNGKFNEMLNEYIEIIDVDIKQSCNEQNDVMKAILDTLNTFIKDDDNCIANKCFEKNGSVVYLFYIQNDNITNRKINNIGAFFSERHEPVIGDCVMLNTQTKMEDGKCVAINVDMTLKYFYEIVKLKFIHKAIIVNPDNEITEHIYTDNPIENTFFSEKSCRCYHVNFINKTFCIFMEYEPEDNRFNKFATLFCRRLKVHGSVLISMISQLPTFEVNDVNKKLFKDVLCVKTNMSEKDIDDKLDDAVKNNFYDILKELVAKYKNEIIETIPDDVLNGQTMNSSLDAH